MRRALVIIGALILGLIGLLMSVCGGVAFLGMARNSVRAVARPGTDPYLINTLLLMLLPAAFALLGAKLAWECVRILRNRSND